jgi:hypothetical protein
MLAAIVLVFLSYSSADVDTARDISSRLRAAGCQVWDYGERQIPGNDWRQDVEKAIDTASVVVALVSAESVRSEHVQDEWAYARLGKKRIVAIPVGAVRVPMIVVRFVWAVKLDRIGVLCKPN